MGQNHFILDLISGLKKAASKKQIQSDIKQIENQGLKIKLIGALDKIKTRAQLKKDTANIEVPIKLTGKLDKSKTKAQIKQDTASLNGTVNLTGKVNKKGIVTSVQQATQQAQNVANKNTVQVSMNLKKDKLINDIKVFGQQNTKLFKDANMTAKYNSLLDNAKLATSSKEIQNLRMQLSAMRSEIKATNLSGLTLGDTFKKTFKRATELFTGTGVVMMFTQQMRQAWREALNLDKAYTDLIKVQDELSRGDYPEYLEQCNKKAQDLATTQQSLIEGATEFSKSGYTRTQSDRLSEKSTILSNVGDMSASDSAKAIISGVQAYDIVDGYDDVIDKAGALIDKYNEIGNTASITTAEIAEGVQKVGSVFADANTSVDEFIAMLAAGNRQFQDADTLSLGLRTAALRIRACKTELESLGEETDNVYTSSSKVAEKIEALTNVDGKGGVQIFEADGETFRSIYDIFVDISKVYQQMSDTDQSALLDLIAGKNRASAISATLNNMSEAQEIYERSLNATGSAQREYDKYLSSSEASLNKFKASMTETYQSVINGETVTGILNCGNATLQFVNSLGLVESTLKGLIAIGIVKAVTTLSTAFKASAIQASNFGTALNAVKNMSTMAKGTTEYTNALRTLKTVSVGLSETQLKQVLASKSLSDSERIAILRTTGLTKAQAQAKLAQMGLTQSTKAQTTANASATASTFSLTAAVKGFGVSLKAAFMSNPVGISIMALSTIIGAVSSKISDYNEKVRETRQANMDAARTAKEKADSLRDLYVQYDNLNSITNKTSSQEEQFRQVVIDITKALGDKAEALNGLTAGTEEYTASLREATKAELESQYATAKIGAKAAEEDLKAKTYSSWDGSHITIQQNEQMTGVEEHVAALEAVKDILAEYEDMGTYGMEWEPVNWDTNRNDMNAVVEYYNALIEARNKLVTADNADFLMSSDIYEDINTTINDLSESVENYTEQQYNALKLNYEWQNGVPSTEEEFRKMEESILDASGAGQEFQEILKGYLAEDFSTFSNSISGIDNEINNVVEDTKVFDSISLQPQSFSEAWSALDNPTDENLKNTKEELLKLAEAGQLSANTLSSVQGAEEYFKQIGLSAQDASNKINELVTSSNQLSSMRSGITSITSALETKMSDGVVSADKLGGFDVSLQGLETWQEFEEVMGNSQSSMAECQEVANKLATEYVNSANFLSHLTEENKDYYVSQLAEMGVTNALEVVNASLVNSENALAVAQSEVAKYCETSTEAKQKYANMDLSSAEADDIMALYNEANASGVATNGLRQLLAAKYNANSLSVATAADCTNLANLYSNSINAANALNALARAKANAQSGKYVPEEQLKGITNLAKNEMKNADKETQVQPTVNVSPVSTGGGGGGGGGGSKKETTKTEINWLERAMTRVGKKLDTFKAKLENLFNVDAKASNLSKQIKLVEKEVNIANKQVKTYDKKASNVKLSKSLKTAVQEGRIKGSLSKLISKYGEKTANKIDTYRTWYDKSQEAKQQVEELTTTLRDLQEQQYQLYVDDAEANIDKLNAQKDIAIGYADQNNYLEQQKAYLQQSYEYQIKIAELTGDQAKKAQLEAELQQQLRDLEKEKFENIQNYYENEVGLLDNQFTSLDNKISEIESSGADVSKSYYESQKTINDSIRDMYDKEKQDLLAQLPYIQQGTDTYYEALDAIQECDNKISDCVKTTYDLNNAINELHFNRFSEVADDISRVITEQEFLQGLFAHEKTINEDTAQFTDAGIAKLGSMTGSYYLAKQKAERDAAEVAELQKMVNTGSLSSDVLGITFNSTDDLQAKLKEMYATWQDDIKETYSLESDMVDMMKDRYQSELDLVQELIDKKKESLTLEKDLHDYQRTIQQKVTDINTLRKQITATRGDTSQEGLAKLQKLQVELSEKEDDLRETEYDRFISDQQDMLDKLYEEYEELITKKLDDFMGLFKEATETSEENQQRIGTYLSNVATDAGYTEQTKGLFSGISTSIKTNADNIVAAIEKISITTSTSATPVTTTPEAPTTPTTPVSEQTNGGSIPIERLQYEQDQQRIDEERKKYEQALVAKQTAETFIKNHLQATNTKKKDMTSEVNKVITTSYPGKCISDDNQKKLANKLGVSSTDYKKKSGALYQKLHELNVLGFSRGGVISVDSLEKQVKANGDSTLVSGNPGERILTPVQNDLFEKFVGKLPELNQMTNMLQPIVDMPKMTDIQPVQRDISNNINAEYNFTLENCTNADDIIRQIQQNSKVQKALRAVTTDQMIGSGRLSVNRIR